MKFSLLRLANIRSLFAPSLQQCLICGKHSQPATELPGVCAGCEAAIPWIRCPRCSKCGRHVGCPDCTRSSEPGPLVCNRSAVAYTSVMREILGRYKYRGDEKLASMLGLMLDRAYSILKEEREQQMHSRRPVQSRFSNIIFPVRKSERNLLWKADLLVPVPVSDSRLVERGFNQAERLAEILSRRRGIPQLPLLIRTHHTGKQSFKTRAERLADMKHAFAASRDSKVLSGFEDLLELVKPQGRPLQVIIVDDIYTTGSTIRACAETLIRLSAGLGCTAEIYSLTWARS